MIIKLTADYKLTAHRWGSIDLSGFEQIEGNEIYYALGREEVMDTDFRIAMLAMKNNTGENAIASVLYGGPSIEGDVFFVGERYVDGYKEYCDLPKDLSIALMRQFDFMCRLRVY